MTAPEMTLEEYLQSKSKSGKHAPHAQPEYADQCAVFTWAKLNEATYPSLRYLFSTLNGIRLTPHLAMKAKKAGNKRGVPDIWLPIRNGAYSGLVIELKHGDNRPSPEQKEWIAVMSDQGFLAVVSYGVDQTIAIIEEYLKGRF